MKTCLLLTGILAVLISSLSVLGKSQEEVVVNNASNIHLAHMPGTPNCFAAASEQGDPSKGASIMLMKGKPGCAVPWHWHPATENIMMVSGTARAQIKDQPSVLLAPRAYMSVPPKHVMRFACLRECTLFVSTDGVFAMHYVDEQGNEISPTEALRQK